MKPLSKRPSAIELTDGSGALGLNVAAVIRFLWDMDLADSKRPELVARIRAWRERVEIVRHACAILAVPPTLDDLLWEHGNGAEIERRIAAIPRSADALSIRTDFDLFDVILTEPEDRS